MTDPVLYSSADGIAEIRFNRPDVLNALDLGTATAFVAAVDRALTDPGVRVILFSGAGRSFMAGGDLGSFRGAEDPAAMIASIIDPLHDAILRLADSPKITLAAAQGPVAGAGMSFFLGADLGLLADDASLSTAYVRIAGSPDCGGTAALERLVGMRKAMELLLLSDPLPAAEAERLGLANRVVPAAALMEEARALALRLAKGPAEAQSRIKALIRGAAGRDLKGQLQAEADSFIALAGQPDFREGLDAFFAKRAPTFG